MATRGVATVMRQALVGGDYELVDRETHVPNPSYWLAALWRHLIAPTVLEIAPGSLPPAPSPLQVSLHCAAQRRGTPIALALNFASNRSYVLDLYATMRRSADDGDEYLVHLLTSESLSSKVVRLNGEALMAAPDGSLPSFEEKARRVKGPVTLPPASVAFVQLASDGVVGRCG